jgi:hypothetical protein
MRKYVHQTLLLATLLASALILAAQTDQGNNPFVGRWQLNVAKSKFSPGPPPKSETVTIAPDGKVTVEGVDPQDKSFQWSYTRSGDAAVPIEGMENATVMEKMSGNTVDHTWKVGGGNTTGHGVVSKDGRTMTYTQNGTDHESHRVHNVIIFEKQ